MSSTSGKTPGAASADGKESTTIKFEWTLRGLKSIFENSNGESKSKVTKSPRFGDGRWQILFYANSGNTGTNGQTFVSVYLASEPTDAEKDAAVNGKWSRDGLFDFVFEIRSQSKGMLFNSKEARDHSFYYPGAQNWGWAQFATRDSVYFQQATVKMQDAFTIICSITSAPRAPPSMPVVQRNLVPRDLLESMGSLLDDPLYSDVEFVLPRRRRTERTIYASRKLLTQRVDYFDAMFNAGFSESAIDDIDPDDYQTDDASVSDAGIYAQRFDDSDFEDDDEFEDNSVELGNDNDYDMEDVEPQDVNPADANIQSLATTTAELTPTSAADSVDGEDAHERDSFLQDSDHPSPQMGELSTEHQYIHVSSPPPQAAAPAPVRARKIVEVPGPKKTRVVVRDFAYTTYRAVLYYIYTDTIAFAPLSSTWLPTAPARTARGSMGPTPAADSQPVLFSALRANQPSDASIAGGPRSRKEWIADWEINNFGRPRPASAKSVYRLADKLGLPELKDRASRYIVKSLTVENIVHEAFSAFSAAFEDIRKAEVSFLFEHWAEVRTGAMLSIGQQLRLGRFPGFEEVWPTIIQNLVMTEEKKAEGDALTRN